MAYATIGTHEKAHRGDVPEGPGTGADRSGKDDGRSAKPKAKGQEPERKTVGAGGTGADGEGFLHSAALRSK